MEKIKIAIAEKDGKVANSHFGDSEKILFYTIDLENNTITFEKEIKNPLKDFKEEKHGSEEKLKNALEILKDREVIASGKPSPNFKKLKEKFGKIPVVIQSTDNINISLARIADTIKEIKENGEIKFNRGFYLLV
ncbi:iron-molybdenum cofactor-binding protein [Thermotomaculum hydrothermale]|uniref:Iron-molybdenum cofactor-binding protein n=1 Tax=Thermotomaculum hydrothermale TaxID=981385 RepID=A0A7R6SXN6_9BACT|nr:NifB/NifX family molybdenum-iron cluster-binding protein [Thermotomaculum hydrothermale]BBB31994.1 iron-molybdenum cofactor-binding protein [Thermotomaculum hydrothermale]